MVRGHQIGCQAVQIFTKSARAWKPRPLEPEDIRLFKENVARSGISPVFAHDSYLINLAAGDDVIREKSIEALSDEVQRCDRLALPYLVIHPGSCGTQSKEMGIEKIPEALRRVFMANPHSTTRILLETTSGQGTSIGARFEELAAILDQALFAERLGVCLDTCHIFAAGYEVHTQEGYEKTMEQFDRLIGLEKLFVFHLNDSKKPFSSRVDRHEHIGKGQLGLEPFRRLLNDPRFVNHPMVLETPKGPDMKEDIENLTLLRSLII